MFSCVTGGFLFLLLRLVRINFNRFSFFFDKYVQCFCTYLMLLDVVFNQTCTHTYIYTFSKLLRFLLLKINEKQKNTILLIRIK
jgi:hypothetical protein